MENTIAKSPEMLRREAEVKSLKEQLKKRQTTLKSIKTRLKNMQEDVSRIHRDVQVQMFHKLEALDRLRMELAELAKQLKNVKGLSREEKKQLTGMVADLSQAGLLGEEFEQYKEHKQKLESGNFDFEENARAKMQDAFQAFKVKPGEKEQKDIRKVYLKLSQKFHPDLARGEREAAQFHELMQQINEAYRQNDIQTLLELESLFAAEGLDMEAKSLTVDVLQAEAERLKRELALIEKQIERSSEEIKNIRESELGQMLSAMGKAERQGNGLESIGQELDADIEMLTKLKEGMEDSVRLGRISPKLEQLVNEAQGYQDDDLENMNPMELLMRMASGDEQAMDFFGGLFEENEVENPKFPIGSSVQVSKSVKTPGFISLNMKGWTGRVAEAYYDENDRVAYNVSFDSLTMSQMPETFVKQCVFEDFDFQEQELMENQLQACPARDTEEETKATYRLLYHQYHWDSLKDKAQAERLRAILLAEPALNDDENWTIFLRTNLIFPFQANSKGSFGISKKQSVTVLGLIGYNEEVGHIVSLTMEGKRKAREYPLQGLQANHKKDPAGELLKDYAKWANYFLGFWKAV